MFKRSHLAAVASPPPDREQLKAAITARGGAQNALDAAAAIVARVQSVIDRARDAASLARKADASAKSALANWAQGGCDPACASEHQRLRVIADETKREADHALIASEAAQKGLDRINETVEQATRELRTADERIENETGRVLAGEVAGEMEAMRSAAEKYHQSRLHVIALYRHLRQVHCEKLLASDLDHCAKLVAEIPEFTFDRDGNVRIVDAQTEMLLQLIAAWGERVASLRVES